MLADRTAVARAWATYQSGDSGSAIQQCQALLQGCSEDADLWCLLGIIQRGAGLVRQAAESQGQALRLRDNLPEAHLNLAHALLALGDWRQGFAEYEWRWRTAELGGPRYPDRPAWDGSPLGSRTILLSCEQGAGDTILFVRYAALVKARGGRVLLACPKHLRPLLSRCEGVDQFVDADAPPAFDCHAPLPSLPRIFGSTPDNLHAAPYLSADPALVDSWRRELASVPGLKVGIAWQGNPQFKTDHLRSVPLRHYEALAHVPGVSLVSLQKAHGLEQLRQVSFPVLNLDARLDESAGPFVHTAAVLKNLDLFITSDTSVAHLAGALGVRAWVAIPFAAHWFWLLEREDCPWYPTLRLFRQRKVGDWASLFERIGHELGGFARSAQAAGALAPTAGPVLPAFPPSAARQTASGSPASDAVFQSSARYSETGPGRLASQPGEKHRAQSEAVMATDRTAITRAWNAYRAGDAAGGARVCHEVLKDNPGDADVWCLLGVIQRGAGNAEEAAASQREALRLRPDFAEAWNNLGNCLVSLGKIDEAVKAFEEVLRLRPDSAEAHNNLGVTLRHRGKLAEAVPLYEKALALQPNYPDALNNLGDALFGLNRLDESIQAYQRALQLRPGFPEVHSNLGNVLVNKQRYEEASTHFREALRLKPDYPEAHVNLGNALIAQRKYPEAEASYREALRLKPNEPQAHHNLGTALAEQGHPDQAEACYREALRIRPDYAEASGNLAIVLQLQSKPAEAIKVINQILERKPDDPDIHLQLSLALLLMGEWQRGLEEFEWRWKCPEFGSMPYSKWPSWDGSSLEGKTILLHIEQGVGDVILFSRYAPMVKARGARVILTCRKALTKMLANFPGVDLLVEEGSTLPYFDCHAPLASLPRIFGTTPATVPAQTSYLSAQPELVEHWRRELAPLRGLKVAIAWQGNPQFKADRIRSVPLKYYEPLARVPGVHLISIQKGHGIDQLRQVNFPVLDLDRRLDEGNGAFMDTMAVLKNVDVFVTSDTSVVHLAGALGVPTWMATSYSPHWYWLLERQDCPWYPSLRLFRQPRAGDWGSVFERIAGELGVLAQKRPAMPRLDVGPGELCDRIASMHANNKNGAALEALQQERGRSLPESEELSQLASELENVHVELAKAEEGLRKAEAKQDFGATFVRHARAALRQRHRRDELIAAIDELVRRK